MFSIGTSEIAIILLLALILLGPKKIPEIAKTIGKFIAKAREVSSDIKDEIEKSADSDEDEKADEVHKGGDQKG